MSTTTISKRAQEIANRLIIEGDAMSAAQNDIIQLMHDASRQVTEAFVSVDNGRGAWISAIVSELAGLLNDADYRAFRSELNGLDLGQRLTVCKKWLSMVLVLKAALWKNRARRTSPMGAGAFRFYKAVDDARACGWTIQDSRAYTAKVDFVYWGKADVDESGQVFDDNYVPFEPIEGARK